MRDYSPFVPFDLYDFFGYLFPGMFFGGSLLVFLAHWDPDLKPVYESFALANKAAPFIVGLFSVLGGIVVFYVLGHFVATISHIIIDRVLIDGVEGYPITFLLQLPRQVREFSEAAFKYLFAVFNLLLLIPVFIGDYSWFRTLALFCLFCIAFLILQRFIVMVVRMTDAGKERAHSAGNKPFFRTFLIPSKYMIDPCIGFLRRLLGLDRAFPESVRNLYVTQFNTRFPTLEANSVGSENYWLPAFHSISNSPYYEKTLQTWLHLYGFCRNASAACYVAATLIIGHLLYHPGVLTPFTRIEVGILWVLAVTLGLRYWILYSHYYSKAVIRAFIETTTRQKIGTSPPARA